MRRLILIPLLMLGLASPALAQTEKKKGGGESFVVIPTLNATVTRPTGRRGVLTVELGLDIKDRALRTRAEQSRLRLRDAYLQVLLPQAAALSPGEPPDPDSISRVLQQATDRVLGKPGARLLIGGVMVN